jgi:hypothetical protein
LVEIFVAGGFIVVDLCLAPAEQADKVVAEFFQMDMGLLHADARLSDAIAEALARHLRHLNG